MIILAHRANLSGPNSVVENSLTACEAALKQGFGLETDLRRDPHGLFYINHDAGARTLTNCLELYTDLFRKYPGCELAINVKELGYESRLIELMTTDQLGVKSFFFDFELLEPRTPGAAQRKIKALPSGDKVRVAARVSDRNEPLSQGLNIPGEIAWGDEFEKLWLTRRDVEILREAGRTLYMISPELHGFDLPTMRQRWQDFRDWGVDGVCTDYPIEAKKFFENY